MSDRNKYNHMENVLQEINKKCIALNDKEVENNNKILHQILNRLINEMMKDKFFKRLYRTNFFGGSFYDGVKVGYPEEFDLDLIFDIPVSTKSVLSTSNVPGFVHVQLTDVDKYLTLPEAEDCKQKLNKLLDGKKYLSTDGVLNWFKGVVDRALNTFKDASGIIIMNVDAKDYKVTVSSSGPAYTLKCSGNGVKIDVDLVPCFIFNDDKWPNGNYRKNTTDKHGFLIVPKSPKDTPSSEVKSRYWRLSFQEQERRIIDNKGRLKSALKLIKKLRDMQDHKLISSYFIKTIFLWEVEERESKNDNEFWNFPLSYVFVTMLQKYAKYLENKNIPYFWNKKNNLLPKDGKTIALDNYAQRIKKIVLTIEKNSTDANKIKDFLLPDEKKFAALTI